MPWVRFDDQYPIHRKVDGLSDAAFRLHTSAVFWCARNLTDGFVSREDLGGVTARVRTPERFASECVKRGTWHDAREPCPSLKCPQPVDQDGWRIHDYLDYQPSREQVKRDREASAKRQANWRARRNGSSNAVTNDVSNSSPSRPAPKEAGRADARPERGAGRRANPPGSPAAAAIPPKCEHCDDTRHIGDPPARCPRCHPLATGIEAQAWRATHQEAS